jgi:hypothetical protein
MMVASELRKSLNKADDFCDVWGEVCAAAKLDLDRDVPMQGQRHLIQSWAGVAVGVRLMAKRLQSRMVSLLDIVSQRDTEINELNAQLQGLRKASHELELASIAHRVGQVFADNAGVPNEVKALILSEIAA